MAAHAGLCGHAECALEVVQVVGLGGAGEVGSIRLEPALPSTKAWNGRREIFHFIPGIGLHIAAVLYYVLRKRNNLLRPMLTGDKVLPAATPASRDGLPQRVLAVVLLCVCAGIVGWVVKLGS